MTEWEKTRWARCPKCDRNCSVAGYKDGQWYPIGKTKKNSDTEFQVECGGCGVLFNADIQKPVPCWEEPVN